MDAEEEDLCLLTALLEENKAASGRDPHGGPDTFDELFDADGDGESYTEAVEDEEGGAPEDQKENVAALFGDVGDLTDEEEGAPPQPSAYNAPHPGKTHQELQDELRKLQEQMKALQEQLQMATIAKPAQPLPPESRDQGDSAPRPPLKEKRLRRIQESTCFSAELDVPAPPRAKRVARTPKVDPKTPAEPKSSPSGPAVAPTRPLQSTPGNEPGRGVRGQRTEAPRSPGAAAEPVSVEAFSGLRLRRPRVSSTEMNKKMVGRKLVRLSQLQEKLATEKLDEIDWVTFGVILKKVTPQSCNSGKTFSIWRLNDLRDLTRHVSLFLFGDVHRQLWKTAEGSVVGLLNANPMKPRDGSEEVCLSIDHPQKILVMGEALDLGTCRAKKKNGEPCTQTVNLRDCEYCQYHIQAQYKRLSAKRPDLQSSFSGGRIPKKFARRGASLKERLCQDGFYYGGVSSASYAASLAPKKKIQTTLSHLVVRGSDQVLQETQRKLGMPQKSLSCSEEFKELMDLPTFGARNLKQHLAKATSGATGLLRPAIQSISASALLKQQKQQMLEMRKKRAEEIQKRSLQSASQLRDPTVPPPSPPPPPGTPHAGPQLPRLGRGIAEGDDILFYDESPPPKPQLGALAEARKLAAITKLRAKGQILTKTNPNTIKKKPKDPRAVLEVKGRVEKSISGPAPAEEDLEPARKRRKEQQAYLESEEFQKILKARSRHTGIVKEAEAELQERYFEPLVKKEQLEEKMRSTRSVKCRVVTCRTCAYTHFQPRETCVSEQHNLRWHEAVKSFFRCPCGNRTISLDRLPKKHCSNCGLFKWERDGMLKEKTGPKIGGETLLPRGEEHAKFLNSLK